MDSSGGVLTILNVITSFNCISFDSIILILLKDLFCIECVKMVKILRAQQNNHQTKQLFARFLLNLQLINEFYDEQ